MEKKNDVLDAHREKHHAIHGDEFTMRGENIFVKRRQHKIPSYGFNIHHKIIFVQ